MNKDEKFWLAYGIWYGYKLSNQTGLNRLGVVCVSQHIDIIEELLHEHRQWIDHMSFLIKAMGKEENSETV